MYRYRRVFQISHLGRWNFAFWASLAFAEWVRTLAFAASNLEASPLQTIVKWPISYYLMCWLLSSAFMEVYFQIRTKPSKQQVIGFCTAILLFGFSAKILGDISAVLLERLFYGSEQFTWQLFLQQFLPTLPFVAYGSIQFTLYLLLLKGLDFYGRLKSQSVYILDLEQKLINTQLQTLKMQLKPHFLFNALNTIAMMVRRKSGDAVDMISGLSDLLRSTLTAENRQFVTLEEEIQLLAKYLSIESVRYQDRLKVELSVDPASTACKVPNLLLQPLVENAFKHGIAHSIDVSLIRISTEKKASKVFLSVFNSGSSIPENWEMSTLKGVGLLNTVNRLRQLYKGGSKFEISNREGGVIVTIEIPYQILEK